MVKDDSEVTLTFLSEEIGLSREAFNLAECAFELADELEDIIEGGALLRIVAVVGDPPLFDEFEHPSLCFI